MERSDIAVVRPCLCGGDYLEDVSEIGLDLRLAPGSHVPSSDTIGRAIKELTTDNINYTAKSSGKSYAFNTNHHTLQPARGKGEGLRLAEQRLHVEAPAVLIPQGEHRIHDTHGHLKELLHSHDAKTRGNLTGHHSQRKAQAIHLPFRHSAGKMDKNGKGMGAQTLYGQTLR